VISLSDNKDSGGENFESLKAAFEDQVAENAKKRQHMSARYKQDINPTMYLNVKLNVLMDSILTQEQKLQVSLAVENLMSDALDETLQQLARAELLEGVLPR
jgi:uncharacterized protein (UPF0276 family)